MSSTTSSPAPKPSATDLILQARLTGRSEPLDRRINAVRADLADIALAGQVTASRYSAPVTMRCTAAVSALRSEARSDATQVSELLHGEDFAVFDRAAGWAWGQAARDGYVGWIEATALGEPGAAPTHIVSAPAALRFSQASLKSRVLGSLALGSRLVLGASIGDYLLSADGSWIHHRHVAPLSGDTVDLALAFVGTPYHWGGRTRAGIDCSGLVQTVLRAHGVTCPRDADQQRAAFEPVLPAARRRGDLVFVPGHVAMVVDNERIVHANAHWMTILIEPLDALLDRLESREYSVARPPCGVNAAPL